MERSKSEPYLKSKDIKSVLKVSDCELMHLRQRGQLEYIKKGNAYFYSLPSNCSILDHAIGKALIGWHTGKHDAEICNSHNIKFINQNEKSSIGNYYKFTIISPEKNISDLLPKLKTTTSKVYEYFLGNSKKIPMKHLCLPIWYDLEENVSDKVIKEIKESLGV